MKYPPIFQVAASDPGVTDLLGTNPTRLYLFGLAPEKPVGTYCVWQVVNGARRAFWRVDQIAEAYGLQLDVYASTASAARAAGHAIEYAIELSATITSYNGETKDAETGLYRYSFDVDWIVRR